ncbi:MAG: cell cycle protein [Acidobacteria bacterium OLB17]|nr:MAG: cell cycle protein [Acidobacteria bacterium OLB17]
MNVAQEQRTDWFMFALAAGLALFGTLMVYSASAMIAYRESQETSQFGYFYKQLAFALIGIVLMFIISRVDYRILNNRAVVYGIVAITTVMLVAVFFFPAINGAKRWIRFGGFSLQPSEIAKLALPVFLAWLLTKNEDSVGDLRKTVFPCVLGLLLLAGLVMAEKDLGTTMVLCAIFSALYFAAGARVLHIGIVAAAMVFAGLTALIVTPWRVARLMAFLDPYKYSDDAGYQVVQSLYAIGSGGILGEGFAQGQAKLFYLPYPYSDFIFSVVGEELGLIGTLGVVLAFAFLFWRGTRAALLAPDRFGMLLGIGLITGLIVQALFNISVVISILPAKGIPLPFISYGGSSVVASLAAVGVLLSISRFAGEPEKVQPARRANGRRRR